VQEETGSSQQWCMAVTKRRSRHGNSNSLCVERSERGEGRTKWQQQIMSKETKKPGSKASMEDRSQNHRMVGVGRDLCGSSSPTLLPKQGHLQQAARDCVQAGLEYLQRRRVHNLPGQPVPVLHHPQRVEVLPHVQTELPFLQFVPIAPCPVTGHH